MLFCYLVNSRFILLVQSGFYVDFFLKKMCEVFVKNVFIYTAQFFGEKYIIEVLTKKVIDSFIFNNSKFFHFNSLGYGIFFHVTTLIFLYTFSLYILFNIF